MEKIIRDLIAVTNKTLGTNELGELTRAKIEMAFCGGMAAMFDIMVTASAPDVSEEQGALKLEEFEEALRKVSMETGSKIQKLKHQN